MRHVGVDLLRLSRLEPLDGQWNDPFFRLTFTSRERELCLAAPRPIAAFAAAFAAKEAVFKCLGIPSDHVRLDQIEILRGGFGQPTAELLEPLRSALPDIHRIHLSISYEDTAVIAFAVSE